MVLIFFFEIYTWFVTNVTFLLSTFICIMTILFICEIYTWFITNVILLLSTFICIMTILLIVMTLDLRFIIPMSLCLIMASKEESNCSHSWERVLIVARIGMGSMDKILRSKSYGRACQILISIKISSLSQCLVKRRQISRLVAISLNSPDSQIHGITSLF